MDLTDLEINYSGLWVSYFCIFTMLRRSDQDFGIPQLPNFQGIQKPIQRGQKRGVLLISSNSVICLIQVAPQHLVLIPQLPNF
jgi:hypothetical protein